MTLPDLITATFECGGGFLIWLSIFKLHKDKIVRGVHWAPVTFFAAWGYWNLFFYAHLNLWASWLAGINITIANTIWVIQMIHYIRKEHERS